MTGLTFNNNIDSNNNNTQRLRNNSLFRNSTSCNIINNTVI